MKTFVLAGVLAALAHFAFGALYWGVSPALNMGTSQSADDPAAQEALRSVLPESGSYVIPHPNQDKAVFEACHEEGPLAIVHLKAEGMSPQSPAVMIRGFLHSLASALGLAFLMKLCLSSLPGYGGRLGFAACIGALGALVWDGGAHVWWLVSGSWTLSVAAYNLLAFVAMGAVLAAFIKPAPAAD